MYKKIAFILSALILLCIFTASTAFASVVTTGVSQPRLVDMADLLTENEETALLSKLDEISERQQFDIVILTENSIGDNTPEEYADDYYDYNGYGYGTDYDGVLLLVSMEYRDLHISTCGYGIEAFTDYGMERMTEQFSPYLSDGDYAEAFDVFADLCDEYISLAKEGTPVDAGSDNIPKAPFNFAVAAVGSVLAGLLVGFIATGAMKKQLKTVEFQRTSKEYIVPGSMRTTYARDIFLYNEIFRTEKPQESDDDGDDDDGGSSVHVSSSGRTHGGHSSKF